jgi:hypothetical protein
VPDPYFSATKLEWLLARTDARPGELAFGTVDSWLVWKLTDGSVQATDLTNTSRTMLLDLESLSWDDQLLKLFGVDRALLPREQVHILPPPLMRRNPLPVRFAPLRALRLQGTGARGSRRVLRRAFLR